MKSLTTLEQLTKGKFLTEKERENLKNIASKITKIPEKIIIPLEYIVDND